MQSSIYTQRCNEGSFSIGGMTDTRRERHEHDQGRVMIVVSWWFKTDRCIFFWNSFLTPLPSMRMEFTIHEKKEGPSSLEPGMPFTVWLHTIYCWFVTSIPFFLISFQTNTIRCTCLPPPPLSSKLSAPSLRQEVKPETAVLGFVGCHYTLTTYLVKGKIS